MMNSDTPRDMRHAIITLALSLAQTRGFNAFSYRDLANALGIKSASIHYYFATKADLGRELARHYLAQLDGALARIAASGEPALTQYRQFVTIFDATAKQDGRMCLGGMLASDLLTLPESLQADVRGFFEHAEQWVARLLAQGRDAGEFAFAGDPGMLAATLVAALEGGLLTGRAVGDPQRPAAIGGQLEALFRPALPGEASRQRAAEK